MNILKFFRYFSDNVIKELHNEIFMNLRSLLLVELHARAKRARGRSPIAK